MLEGLINYSQSTFKKEIFLLEEIKNLKEKKISE